MFRVPRLAARRVGVLVAALGLGAGVVLSGCGGSSSAASDVTVIDIQLGRYTITPALVSVPTGKLELRVTNVDVGLVHNLVVAGKGTKPLAPGDSQTVPMGTVSAGEYRMWCDVQGHAQMGQSGVFRVEPVAPAATLPAGSG